MQYANDIASTAHVEVGMHKLLNLVLLLPCRCVLEPLSNPAGCQACCLSYLAAW